MQVGGGRGGGIARKRGRERRDGRSGVKRGGREKETKHNSREKKLETECMQDCVCVRVKEREREGEREKERERERERVCVCVHHA